MYRSLTASMFLQVILTTPFLSPCNWLTLLMRAGDREENSPVIMSVLLKLTLCSIGFRKRVRRMCSLLCSSSIVFVCVRAHACLSVCLYLCLFYLCVCVCLSVSLSVWLPVCESVCLYICLSACLFVCLYVCVIVCLSVYLFVCLSICLSTCLSVCLAVCLFVMNSWYYAHGDLLYMLSH